MSNLSRKAELVVDSFQSWLPLFGYFEDARVDEAHGVRRWTSPVPLPLFNGLFGAPAALGDELDAAIEDILAPLDGTPLLWVVPPPADITAQLEARGFGVQRHAGMAIDLDALPPLTVPEGVTLTQVDDDRETLEAATTIAFTTNGFPEWVTPPIIDMLDRVPDRRQIRTFLASVDGVPAASSTLLRTERSAALYNVGTLPEFRRRGLGALVSLAAMEAGREEGFDVGVLFSSPEAESVYKGIGFVECCRVAFGVRVPSQDA